MAKPTSIDLAIGERIHENRLARGLSLQDLSKAVGVTHKQIQKYERGTCRVSAATLYRLADALSATSRRCSTRCPRRKCRRKPYQR